MFSVPPGHQIAGLRLYSLHTLMTDGGSDRAKGLRLTGGLQMKVFVAGGTGVIGRPLVARLLAKGHSVVVLVRSKEKTEALVKQGIEPAIADVFDRDAVKAVVTRAQPEIVIEQLTALPRTYTRESMTAAGPLNTR